jgi:ribonuclease HII
MDRFERQATERGFSRVAGLDEAGRGPLAGPVVAAAVILPEKISFRLILDSKQLTSAQREEAFEFLLANAVSMGVGIADASIIDNLNIYRATKLSMLRAVEDLTVPPDYLLVDGLGLPEVDIPQMQLIKGDRRSLSIAAASIVAKVTRDRLMYSYAADYPQYAFDQHKGYATETHKAALARYGPCPIHRKTFRGVREFFEERARPLELFNSS